MMRDGFDLTLNEAGYVVRQSARAINRAVDREKLRVGSLQRGGAALRTIGAVELRYLAISGAVAEDLTPTARRKLYEAVRRLPTETSTVELGVMTLRLVEIDRGITERLGRLAEIRAAVEERPGSDPVVRGTDVSIYALAALAAERSATDIVRRFPGLAQAQIALARDYAAIYPRTGRPVDSFKRMLADMAGSGVWDVQDDEPIAPSTMP